MLRASVIIPTRDRADRLECCLESLTRQTLPPEEFEVLVIDNGSTDSTPDVARRFSERLNLVYFLEPDPGLHSGRHAGVRNARAEILLFGEDDLDVEPTWVAGAVAALDDNGVALAGGNLFPKFEGEVPGWLDLWWSRPIYRGRAFGYLGILDFGEGRFDVHPAYVWGGNFAVRRSALEAVGGFHPDGMPQELITRRGDGESYTARAIHQRVGRVVFDSRISVRHTVAAFRMKGSYLEKRAYNQGISDSYTRTRRSGRPSSALLAWGYSWLRALNLRFHYSLASMRNRGHPHRAELLSIQLATTYAWAEGYRFHQGAVRGDAKLLEWVLKERYL
ncbi:MAG: glycosyltransferase family 2 protein [Candidatus Binatia bacterium]